MNQTYKTPLKKNELADLLAAGLDFIKQHFQAFLLGILGLLVLSAVILGLKLYRVHAVKSFNQEWFEGLSHLLKEEKLKSVIEEYKTLPAHLLASLDLANYQIENQNSEGALQTLENQLKDSSTPLLSTMLVLKGVEIHEKNQNKALALEWVQKYASKVLPLYLPNLKLKEADLKLELNQKEEAKALYKSLMLEESAKSDSSEDTDFKSDVAQKAKARLLELELGLTS